MTDELDAWGMAWVHQVYRREFHILPNLVFETKDGDTERAAVVSEHIDDITASLHEHHVAEDELLWPLLLERAAPESGVVHRMEAQHETLAELLRELGELLPRWREGAARDDRDRLADVVARASASMDEHLADEEAHVMPLVEQHITADEWMAFERRGHESIPQEKALLFLGLGLEDATPHERDMFVGGLPPGVMQMWNDFGKAEYERQRAVLLGSASSGDLTDRVTE
jgi:hemerythrin-like domain-containing protein